MVGIVTIILLAWKVLSYLKPPTMLLCKFWSSFLFTLHSALSFIFCFWLEFQKKGSKVFQLVSSLLVILSRMLDLSFSSYFWLWQWWWWWWWRRSCWWRYFLMPQQNAEGRGWGVCTASITTPDSGFVFLWYLVDNASMLAMSMVVYTSYVISGTWVIRWFTTQLFEEEIYNSQNL